MGRTNVTGSATGTDRSFDAREWGLHGINRDLSDNAFRQFRRVQPVRATGRQQKLILSEHSVISRFEYRTADTSAISFLPHGCLI